MPGMSAGVITTIISAVVSVASATAQGVVSAKQADAAIDQAAFNAATERNEATEVENANIVATNDEKIQLSRDLAKQRAVMASKGVSLDSVSSLSLFDDTELQSQTKIDRLDFNANQKAKALRQNSLATIGRGSAQASAFAGESAISIINGGTTVAKEYFNFKNN